MTVGQDEICDIKGNAVPDGTFLNLAQDTLASLTQGAKTRLHEIESFKGRRKEAKRLRILGFPMLEGTLRRKFSKTRST